MLVTASIYSVVQPLTDVFETVLKFFHNSGGISWGFSIVLLTVCVRAVLIPLTLRQIKSMVRMQSLAPQIKEIQAKYKEDKQRQQQEMMKFYKENNVNPLGSCLPLLLQLPVFLALYAMLRESLRVDICPDVQKAHNHGVLSIHHTVACGDHRASHFLFIPDITNKATGAALVVLIILYVGSQLGSSVLMSSASMDKTQRQIMMFMPLIFVLFVIRFPAGVLVYWITTNLWTIGQQYVVKRTIGPTRAVVATTGASGGSGGAATVSGSSGSGSGGGLGALLRERIGAASQAGQRSGAGGDSSRSSGGRTATQARPTSRKARGGSGGSGNGSASGNGKNGAGVDETKGSSKQSSSGSGAGSGNASAKAGGPPPKPPRKRKKRSGRRR